MCLADVDGQIDLLASRLNPADREPFILAAEAALAGIAPPCWGPGLVRRVVAPIWRNYFHPPDLDHLSRWEQESARPSRLIERGKIRPPVRPVGRVGIPRPIEYQGVTFPSRQALAAHLSPMCGNRDPNAITGMLIKLSDDADAVLKRYRSKTLHYQGREFHSRVKLAEFLASIVDRKVDTVAAALAKFHDNANDVIDFYRAKDQRAAAREMAEA